MNSSFTCSDFSDFREWLALDLNGITWQGRYETEFEEFWNVFFGDSLSINQVMQRFQYAEHDGKIGPIISWFAWLRQKFLIYSFTHKKLTLLELAKESEIEVTVLANIMRDFFLGRYPHFEEYLNQVFQVGNITSPNVHLTFDRIVRDTKIDQNFDGSHPDEIMPAMEITLYEHWEVFLGKIKKNFIAKDLRIKEIVSRDSWRKGLRFFRDVVVLLSLGVVLIVAIQKANKLYEGYLSDKIKVYEPQFLWLDKSLKFKPVEEMLDKGVKIDFDDIAVAGHSNFDIEEERDVLGSTRFSEESEVTLTSWDSLPKDFDTANLEQSEYEELRKGGYRHSKYGSRLVHRVMIVSVDPRRAKREINKLIERYEATQVDHVKPGTMVPGGVYYSLFIPSKYYREFIGQVEEIDEATLYESKTRRRNPPGMGKVFIWVKSL